VAAYVGNTGRNVMLVQLRTACRGLGPLHLASALSHAPASRALA